MTEAPVTIARREPEALLRLGFWGEPGAGLPAPLRSADTPDGRLIWIEPQAWMLRAPLASLDAAITQLEALAGDAGAVIDITGGLTRFTLIGPAWRELLTIGGVFNVENLAFTAGCTAATVLHHAAIWIDVTADEAADVYCLPSYAEHLAEHWGDALARMAAAA
ncbi:sarcosine oxidase subunit gamma family protein [Phenylobacterium montanum]|uniref:Sarcosine oxidase subunit gamma n=1 Tax=Phenylobacterium montanum TaxID=2823693 RepID=A0A975G4K2_9CAUL|nr:sarcosine oxidase subunit gamma family protein [Caulobacter sp. S6]QUD90458.1 hypothetical protein KCG34_11635 [Caulobacter sp. S6]